ncbi:MAG: GNAT family N-acetyltransferase [Clostridia bacterium]|nr:GNAT family N-acetyltransferase [Clostridia bacterium]
MKKKPMDNKTLKYFARMAAQAYVNDPVHAYVTKSEKFRKRFVYHFMIERLATSNREDIVYIDEEKRGICIWREAHNEYDVLDFLMYPNWVFLWLYWPKTLKTLMAYSHLDVKVFPENTYIISPVFVDPEHQGKGIATKLIKQGIEDLTAKGYKLGLEAQDKDNVRFYEKLGFKVIKHDYWKREGIDNYYMMYAPEKE